MSIDRVAVQQAALATLYRTHVAWGSRYALVDFPDHANVGDSAIWLGELEMLRQVTGRDPDYVSTWHDFDATSFRSACPNGILFLHGGGNLGDIWPHHQHFRERMLAEVRDRPVVQLPQSIQFRERQAIPAFARLAAEHPHFTLYVRDRRSLDFARRHIACPTHLAPDSAFALGHQPRGMASSPLVMLLRTDDERRDHGGSPTIAATVVDWLEDASGLPGGFDSTSREAQARARLDRGLALLSHGRVLVTDRLHGHILAELLDLPHVVLDNDYGKIGAYLETWPSNALTATTMSGAEAAAARLA